MPDPVRLLRTLHRAREAFQATPGRRGHWIELTGADDVLVAGDLHGNLENFRELLHHADLDRQPRRHLVLQELLHGPYSYSAGGDKSHQLLDLVAALKCQYPERVHLLLGNHELAQRTGQIISKNDVDLTTNFRWGVQTAYGAHAETIYQAYLDLFDVLPLALRTPNRVFLCHSVPWADRMDHLTREVLEKETYEAADRKLGGGVHALVWGRDVSLENVVEFLKKVDADLLITGHIASPDGFRIPNERQIILDSLGTPAGYCLFPTTRPLTHPELVECVQTF